MVAPPGVSLVPKEYSDDDDDEEEVKSNGNDGVDQSADGPADQLADGPADQPAVGGAAEVQVAVTADQSADGPADQPAAGASHEAAVSPGRASKKSSKSKKEKLLELTPTPPCRDYANLRTISAMEEMFGEYDKMDVPADIKTITARIANFCFAAQSLAKSFRDAIKELKKAHVDHDKALEQSKAE